MLKCLRTKGTHNLIEDYCTIIGSTEFSLLGLVEDHAMRHAICFHFKKSMIYMTDITSLPLPTKYRSYSFVPSTDRGILRGEEYI